MTQTPGTPDNATQIALAKDHPLQARFPLKRLIWWLIAAILIAGVGMFAFHWAFGKAKVRYTTAVVVRGDIASMVLADGIVQPIKYVDVGAQTSGKLKSLLVKNGDHVEKNQIIAEIDPVLANTALMSANAAYTSMTNQRAMKQAQLVLAKVQYTRAEELFLKGYVSAGNRDIARAAYAGAVADNNSLAAQMKQATALVNTATANLGYTKITAPMSGDIVSISLLEGQTLNASQQAPNILRIADISTVTVWAQVSEADIGNVKPGQHVYFTVLGDTRRWNGKIRQILLTPELINNVVFYDVLFDIPNPKHQLAIQMTAQVFIILAQAKNALLLPIAAIGNAGEGTTTQVKVLKATGTVELRTITIGINNEISVQITDGLQENERVVIGGSTAQKSHAKKAPRNALSGQRGP